MFKGEKGITLVALVVTIVVLLILAGVSISLVIGQNGIVTRAKDTQIAQDKAYARDIVETALKAVEIDRLSGQVPATPAAAVSDVLEAIPDTVTGFTAGTGDQILYSPKEGTSYKVNINLTNFTVTDVAE